MLGVKDLRNHADPIAVEPFYRSFKSLYHFPCADKGCEHFVVKPRNVHRVVGQKHERDVLFGILHKLGYEHKRLCRAEFFYIRLGDIAVRKPFRAADTTGPIHYHNVRLFADATHDPVYRIERKFEFCVIPEKYRVVKHPFRRSV